MLYLWSDVLRWLKKTTKKTMINAYFLGWRVCIETPEIFQRRLKSFPYHSWIAWHVQYLIENWFRNIPGVCFQWLIRYFPCRLIPFRDIFELTRFQCLIMGLKSWSRNNADIRGIISSFLIYKHWFSGMTKSNIRKKNNDEEFTINRYSLTWILEREQFSQFHEI